LIDLHLCGEVSLSDALGQEIFCQIFHNDHFMPISHIPVKHQYDLTALVSRPKIGDTSRMENLRRLRTDMGLTQAQLAEKAGVNQATISKIEKGSANFTADMAEKIARALGVSEVELFDLPELHKRVLAAISRLDPSQREAAIVVLEAMANK
jgi:transcriptional regulator with XRE-family HTH domain